MDLENISSDDSNSPTQRSISKQLLQDYGNLFQNPVFSDITIEVSGKEIRVHKIVLAARSSVFSAMFCHGFKEQHESRIIIEDLTFNTVKEMLRFIYIGSVESGASSYENLLKAADKYNIESLKELCEKELVANLCTANATEILILADMYKANRLAETTMKFIDQHYRGVRCTDGWSQIIGNGHLLERMLDIAKNVSPPSKRAKYV